MARWIRWTTRLAIYHRDGFICVWCGHKVHKGKRHREATLDHIVTRYEGGKNTQNNLATSCRDCNVTRGKRPLGEWLQYLSREYDENGVLSDELPRMLRAMNGCINRKIGRKLCRKKFGRLV